MEQKNSKRRLNSLILLVAFTAIMLIVSTYAWFSTQKTVSISNLTGTVKVAERSRNFSRCRKMVTRN